MLPTTYSLPAPAGLPRVPRARGAGDFRRGASRPPGGYLPRGRAGKHPCGRLYLFPAVLVAAEKQRLGAAFGGPGVRRRLPRSAWRRSLRRILTQSGICPRKHLCGRSCMSSWMPVWCAAGSISISDGTAPGCRAARGAVLQHTGIETSIAEAVMIDGEPVSASRIRPADRAGGGAAGGAAARPAVYH